MDGTVRAPGYGLQKDGCLDRCFQHGLMRQTNFRPLVERGRSATHQLPGNAGSMSGPSDLHNRAKETPRSGPLGQHDLGVLHKSQGRALLEAPFHSSRTPLGIDKAQLALAESDACAGQIEPRNRHVVPEQRPLRRVVTTSANGSENLGNLWQGRYKSLCLKG